MIAIRDDSPRWEEINASQWVHERAGLRHIKTLLPDGDPYHAWANVEFVGTDGSINEVDLLVLTPSGLHLIELKHWQGEISGNGTQWRVKSPSGAVRYVDNPLILANRKAKRLASLLDHYGRQSGRRVRVPFVRAAIFLHAPGMVARLDEVGKQWVYGQRTDPRSGLPAITDLLTQQPMDPRDRIDQRRSREIVSLVKDCGIKPSVADRTIRGILLQPKPFAEGPGWQDYLGGHQVDTTTVRRVRFYLTSKASADDRDLIRRAAEREFRLLQGIHHPGIAHATDLVDHEIGPAVIFEHDEDAVRLDHWLADHGDRLTVDQRLDLVRDLAEVLQYAHSRHLVHRGLNPRAIFVCDPDKPKPRLVVSDWQTGGRVAGTTTQATLLAGTTHVDQLADETVRLFQAPEALTNPDAPGQLLDIFSLGAITYLIFTGQPPAGSPEGLRAAIMQQGGLELSASLDGVPETLRYLVYDATRGDTAKRTASANAFLADLDAVEEELTAPEPAPVIDPLDAKPGDVLDGGLVVVRRLGSGATSIALLVHEEDDDTPLVLKVARDESKRQRLVDEADQMRRLHAHWQVAQLIRGPVEVGGKTALLLEFAGEPTLADELASHGRLSLDLLERYGKDLLDIVEYLDGQGVTHRDIKPANLAARPRPKDKQPHLCIFDFSLAAAPADQITAGTPPYLDPFLGPPRRARYDLAAERFAAAVTLFEMATGTLPRWGDGVANPATIADEVTIAPSLFDPAVADRLAAFFARALRRDARQRFDTTEEMADAWRMIFKDIPQAGTTPPPEPSTAAITADTPLDLVHLTERARSALERFGVRTVGDLVDYDPMALSRLAGVPVATKTEIRRKAKELRALFAPSPRVESEEETERPPVRGIDSLVETLLPRATSRNAGEVRAVAVMLGLRTPTDDGEPLVWPTQSEAAAVLEVAQPQLSRIMHRSVQRWVANSDLDAVRQEMVDLLDARGGVMSAAELAEALIASHGSFAPEPRRTAQAIGLVRAAVEAELSTGGDARVGIRRFGSVVLVGREPDDPTAEHTSMDLMTYAVALGRAAQKLVEGDTLPTPSRAVERLRRTTPPAVMPALSDARLVQLAAAAAGTVAVNAQLQLYPVGMPAERAVRLAAPSLVLTGNQKIDIEGLRNRVRARFPQAEPLPERPALDQLLTRCGVALEWDAQQRVYKAPAASTHGVLGSATRWATSIGPLVDARADAGSEVDARITGAFDRRAFLALLVAPPKLHQARRALLRRYALTEVDVTRVLVETLRSIGVPWELVITSDAKPPTDPDRRSLENAVRHEVVPRVEQAIAAAPGAVLLTEAAPLAAYTCMDVVARLADNATPRPAARLLLVAARRPHPVLDKAALEVLPSQWLWLPNDWLDAQTHDRSSK